ncbi:MAG: hypothetical protein R2856_27950 [Caldilineaceae bacterium]
MFNQLPLDELNGFPSAKSQTIGIACLANVLRRASILGLLSQEQIVELLSALRSTANAKYTLTASAAYASAVTTLAQRCVVIETDGDGVLADLVTGFGHEIRVVNATSWRAVKRSECFVIPIKLNTKSSACSGKSGIWCISRHFNLCSRGVFSVWRIVTASATTFGHNRHQVRSHATCFPSSRMYSNGMGTPLIKHRAPLRSTRFLRVLCLSPISQQT